MAERTLDVRLTVRTDYDPEQPWLSSNQRLHVEVGEFSDFLYIGSEQNPAAALVVLLEALVGGREFLERNK